MANLFDVLRFAFSGKHPGKVLVDGDETYRHWVEPADVVNLELKGSVDLAFANQVVEFDDRGFATVIDVGGTKRSMRVLVLVPFGKRMLAEALICERHGAND